MLADPAGKLSFPLPIRVIDENDCIFGCGRRDRFDPGQSVTLKRTVDQNHVVLSRWLPIIPTVFGQICVFRTAEPSGLLTVTFDRQMFAGVFERGC